VVGVAEGAAVGVADGAVDGDADGAAEGATVGVAVGVAVGEPEGAVISGVAQISNPSATTLASDDHTNEFAGCTSRP
jgi:hypothetical protein